MKPDKPHLFVGSSAESRNIVDVFTEILCRDAHCISWWLAPQFSTEGTSTTFAALCEAAKDYDYALFILTPDDITHSRKTESPSPRDNVVFEMGLFMGAIGSDRIFAALQATDKEIKIPSDLKGVHIPRFDYSTTDSARSTSSINTACRGFATRIRDVGFRKIDLPLAFEWDFCTGKRRLSVELSAAKISRNRREIGKWRLCLAARIHNQGVNFEDDPTMAYSALRGLPETVEENFPLEIAEAQLSRPVVAGDKIQGRLLLVPEGLEFDPTKTFSTALKARCREIERITYRLGQPHEVA